MPFLGEVPIDPAVVVGGDQGAPIVTRDPRSPAAKAYAAIAGNVAARLSVLNAEGAAAAGTPPPLKWT